MATKKTAKRPSDKHSVASVLAELKKCGTAQNRKVYGRHGVSGEMFGVSFADLNRIAKPIKMDHELALRLWSSKNHDARILATMVVDPEAMSAKDLEGWVKELDNYVVSDAFTKVTARGPHAHKKAEAWRKKTKQEWICRVGWMVTASIATREDPTDEKWLQALIPVIKKDIHKQKNRIKDAMNYALIAIGGSHPALTQPALAAADEMGTVEVDHGETGCKTRPAREYIESMLTRRKIKAEKGTKKPAMKASSKKVSVRKAPGKKTAKKSPRKAAKKTVPKK